MPDKPSAASSPAGPPSWLLLAAFILLAGGGAVAFLISSRKSTSSRLDGKLTVLVRPPNRNLEPISVELPGAAPVKSGGAMCLDAHLSEPAFPYFIWIDSAGRVLPLYPWNNERLEVEDISAPPPERRATKLVFSPLLGGNWTFGEQPGTDTVLLVVRRTPLPPDIKLAELLGSSSTAALGTAPSQQEVVSFLSLDAGDKAVSVTHPAPGSQQPQLLAADDPLARLMLALAPHFELIRAARFAHQ